jgi:hypothetical protein
VDDPDTNALSYTNYGDFIVPVYFIIDAYSSSGAGNFILTWSGDFIPFGEFSPSPTLTPTTPSPTLTPTPSTTGYPSPNCDYRENWQLAVRTSLQRHSEWGALPNPAIAGSPAGHNQDGIFDPFVDLIGVQYFRIVREDDGAEAVFELPAPLSQSVRDTIVGCGETNSYVNTPSSTQWTAAYSGLRLSGDLRLQTGGNIVDHMFICGVNLENDADHSVLAFTDNTGQLGNGWEDGWRGDSQAGTLWSLYNDDYLNNRGWSSVQGYPGYKGSNPGTYELYVSACMLSATPTCDDGLLNSDETDVDCGGADCPACTEEKKDGEDTQALVAATVGVGAAAVVVAFGAAAYFRRQKAGWREGEQSEQEPEPCQNPAYRGVVAAVTAEVADPREVELGLATASAYRVASPASTRNIAASDVVLEATRVNSFRL